MLFIDLERVQRRENSIIVILPAVNVKFFLKIKLHRVVKAHLRKGGGILLRAFIQYTVHSGRQVFIKRTELPHLLIFQMPLVLINCSFTIVKSLFPSPFPPSFFWLLHPIPFVFGGGDLGEGSYLL